MNTPNHSTFAMPMPTSGAPGQRASGVVAEASRRLHAVSERLSQFLQQKLAQFEAAAGQCEQLLAERNSLSARREELDRDRNGWERQREQQMREIRGEQDRLIDAWNKIEDEQRRMLARQDMPQGGTAGAPPSEPAQTAEPTPLAGLATGFDSGSVYAEPARQYANAAVALTREEAVEQFQRLKRDCRNHALRMQQNSRAGVNG